MARGKRKSFYAVRRGRVTGIYNDWSGCETQVKGFPNARFKGFATLAEAEAFLAEETNDGVGGGVDDASRKRQRVSAGDGDAHDNNTAPLVHSAAAAARCDAHADTPSVDSKKADPSSPSRSKITEENTPANEQKGGQEEEEAATMTLHPKQQEAVDAAIRGDNVFITGPAGTGKSVVLKAILAHLKRKYAGTNQYVAVAPTGPTAISVGGQTIHSFAGCGVPETKKDFDKCWDKKDHWRELKAMVVEEVSMISGEFWDRLSDVARDIRAGKRDAPDERPFGGVQLILCGDFLQLPPIHTPVHKIRAAKEALARQGKRNVELHLNRGFAFQSKAWRNANLTVVQLDQVFRQSCNKFVSVLHEIRSGKVSPEAESFLQKCNRPLPPNKANILPTVLYAKNKDVTQENMAHLDKLPGKAVSFRAKDYAEAEEDHPDPEWAESVLLQNKFYDECIAERQLSLKKDAQVMLIKNERPDQYVDGGERLVNGSRGIVIGFTKTHPDEEGLDDSSDEDELLTSLEDIDASSGKVYPVVMFRSNRRKTIVPERFESRIIGLGSCCREAIPLKMAWAVTMHKSQGLTLDCVKANVSGVFTEAQAYVALSRATNEDGLELRGFSRDKVRADVRALAFYANPSGTFPRWDEPWEDAVETKKDSGKVDGKPVFEPAPKADCLKGLAFVFTGEPEGYSRDKAEALVKQCGGFVRTSVSGKTNYVVIGPLLEDGRSVTTSQKYIKAKKIMEGDNKSDLKILTKDGLFKLIHEKIGA